MPDRHALAFRHYGYGRPESWPLDTPEERERLAERAESEERYRRHDAEYRARCAAVDPDLAWSLERVNTLTRLYVEYDESVVVGRLRLAVTIADALTAELVAGEGWTDEEKGPHLAAIDEIRREVLRRWDARPDDLDNAADPDEDEDD